MTITNANSYRTDLIRMTFQDNTVVYIDLPSNIANADYRNDVICRWVDETFQNVDAIEIDVNRDVLTNIMCIRVYPNTRDAYNMCFPELKAVHCELDDETIDKIDAFLERVNNASHWVNE